MSTVLMVANQTLAGEAMTTFVRARMRTASPEFTLLVPATAAVHPEQSARLLGTIAGGVPRQDAVHEREDAADYERARSRLERALETLRRAGATVDGIVGNPDPFTAISEVLGRRAFDEVVVFTLPSNLSRWLHLDLRHRVERKFKVPVTMIATA
jgi:hypothetical protein